MPEIKVKIENKIAKTLNNVIICGNSDYTVKFLFDEEWEQEPLKIARFIWNKEYVDVQFSGDTCEMPVVSKTDSLAIGVYAGELRTTTPAIFTCRRSILCDEVIEHSVTPTEYEEIMKILNSHAVDINALKATTNHIQDDLVEFSKEIGALNVTAGIAKAKAEAALANSEANKEDIDTLYDEKNVITSRLTETENTLNNVKTTAETNKADIETLYDEKNTIASRLTETENTLNNVNITAETAKAKAEEALARNVFTDEEKAKLANITNPMIIKGRVDTVEDLPTAAEIGWFYFVGLESASYYQEYCYSETGWEYVGISQEGVDLSNYYTKAQVDSKDQTLQDALDATNTVVGDLAENLQGAYNKINANTADISDLNDEKNTMGTRLTEAENNINNLQTDVSNLQTNVNTNTTDIANLKKQDQTLESEIQGNTAAIADLNEDIGESITGIYNEITSVKNTISPLQSNVDALIDEKNVMGSRLTETENNIKNLKTDNLTNKNGIAINRTTLGTQCKNLLKNTAVTQTIRGINFIVNDDKSITVNGTATAAAQLLVGTIVKNGDYILTGCPSSGAGSTYMLSLAYNNLDGTTTYAHESGNGKSIIMDSEKYTSINVRVQVNSGVTVPNLTFYPMLRYADITDSTYEPYKESVDTRLTKNKSDIAVSKSDIALNRTALGYKRKNLLPYPKSIVKGGITFTCDENGYMTGSNTTSDTRQWTSANAQYSMYLEAGTYYFSSFAETVCTNSDGRAYIIANGAQIVGVSTRETHVEKTFTLSEATTIYVMAKVYDGKVAFMIREADITDDSYEPYKPSIQEQINNVPNLLTQQSSIYLYSAGQGTVSSTDVSCSGLFTNYSSVICIIGYSGGLRSIILPLKFIKSLGTSTAYVPETDIEFKYVDDDTMHIADTASSGAVIGRLQIISLY